MNKCLLVLLVISFSAHVNSQIIVDQTVTPEDAVNNILLGSGVIAENITFSGDLNQIGSFSANGSNVPLGEGVILGTGNVNFASSPDFFDEDIPGPGGNNNTGGGAGGGNFGVGDPDLQIIANVDVNDAAILEFDFEATGDTVQFNFVFASEEYPEYVCGTVNDAFGFFLSGPGIDGGGVYEDNAINLAQIPDTDPPVPVTINSVNPGVAGANGQDVNCDDIDLNWSDYNIYYIANDTQNTDPNIIEYDGFTVVLTAKSAVECGGQYHIKMAIADGGDTAFDSAVFLQAGSFESSAIEIFSTAAIAGNLTFAGDSVIVEGCNNAQFSFFSPNTDLADTIRFEILGSAENMTDYESIADSIIIPQGESEGFITIEAFDDNIVEGYETLIISYVYENGCGVLDTASSQLYIADYVQPTVTLNDITVPCPGDDITLIPETTGFGGFTYLWSDNTDNQNLVVSPIETNVYSITATDICGTEATDDVTVSVVEWPELVLTSLPSNSLCPGDQIQIGVEANGGSPGYTYQWVGSTSTSSTLDINPNTTADFTVLVSDQCETQQIEVTAEVIPWPGLDIITNGGLSGCPGSPINVSIEISGGFPDYTYDWQNNGGTSSSNSFSPLVSSNFTVTVFDQCSSQEAEVFIDVAQLDNITTIYNDTLCVGVSSPFVGLSGGTNSYSYEILNVLNELQSSAMTISETGNSTNYTGNTPGLFEIVITDACPSVNSFSAFVWFEGCSTVFPNVFSPDNDSEALNETFQVLGLEAFPGSSMTIFNRWGTVVYEDTNYTNNRAWDGKNSSGDNLQNGTYFYVFKRSDGEEFDGSITLFRK
ncbi:MAG: gliding motility-associated-like protein [Pseudomonadales bacterium]|jgi:gliding motility-associated-like protein